MTGTSRGAHAGRRDEIDAGFEARSGSDPQRHRADVRIRITVRNEHERGAPNSLDLELRAPPAPPFEDHLPDRAHERQVARAGSAGRAPQGIEAAHGLCIEPDPGREAEAPAVHGSRARSGAAATPAIAAPAARAASTGSRGTPSARGRTLVPPPGQEPERNLTVRAVQRLVVGAVAREDEDRVDVRRCSVGRELGGVAGTLRELGPQVDPLAQRVLDLGDPGAR